MLSLSSPESGLTALQAELRGARIATSDLMSKVASGACRRFTLSTRTAMTARVHRLIASEAWVESALALVELELPQWKLRRLVCEDGLWLCSLGRHWSMPDWLDDVAEARHELLPLAILAALIEARRCEEARAARRKGSVPRCGIESSSQGLCCDNFA
jgi:hypothetical protein